MAATPCTAVAAQSQNYRYIFDSFVHGDIHNLELVLQNGTINDIIEVTLESGSSVVAQFCPFYAKNFDKNATQIKLPWFRTGQTAATRNPSSQWSIKVTAMKHITLELHYLRSTPNPDSEHKTCTVRTYEQYHLTGSKTFELRSAIRTKEIGFYWGNSIDNIRSIKFNEAQWSKNQIRALGYRVNDSLIWFDMEHPENTKGIIDYDCNSQLLFMICSYETPFQHNL